MEHGWQAKKRAVTASGRAKRPELVIPNPKLKLMDQVRLPAVESRELRIKGLGETYDFFNRALINTLLQQGGASLTTQVNRFSGFQAVWA